MTLTRFAEAFPRHSGLGLSEPGGRGLELGPRNEAKRINVGPKKFGKKNKTSPLFI